MTSNWSWRIPLLLQLVPSSIIIVSCLFAPESPRWHMAHGHTEKAREILVKYHGNGDADSPVVALTMKEMAESIELDASDKRWWDYRELYNTKAARYRVFCIWVMGFLASFMGNGVASYFLPVMLQKAGITSEHYQLLINALNTVCSAVCAFIGCLFVDKLGRRKMLLGGTASLTVFLAIICALTATNEASSSVSPASAKALVASIILFGCSFSAGWTPMQVLYPLECMNFTMRAKGMVSLYLPCLTWSSTSSEPRDVLVSIRILIANTPV